MADIINGNLDSIIRGCIQKDQRAQEQLYKKYFGYALSVALLYMNDRSFAIGIVNDSFMKVFAQIKKFDQKMSFKAWLRKIVINTSLDYLRRAVREPGFIEEESIPAAGTSATTQDIMDERDIKTLLGYLPHIYKTVFCLYEIEGYSHVEIAGNLGISESSSRVYLARAKKKLRELYLEYGY